MMLEGVTRTFLRSYEFVLTHVRADKRLNDMPLCQRTTYSHTVRYHVLHIMKGFASKQRFGLKNSSENRSNYQSVCGLARMV